MQELQATLGTANISLTNANTNLTLLASNLNQSLENLASMTASLNDQVISNPTLLRSLSDTIVHADQFVQGLKRFWMFRHLFPAAPPTTTPKPGATNSSPAQSSAPWHSSKAND